VIFQGLDVREGEPMLIASNSGINPVPIEMAQLAKEAGMKVICITSQGYQQGPKVKACNRHEAHGHR